MTFAIRYNPLIAAHKTPIGAAKVNEPVRFRLELCGAPENARVFLVLRKDGEDAVFYEMITQGGGELCVIASCSPIQEITQSSPPPCVIVQITSRGLYFYHFELQTPTGNQFIGCDSDLNASLGSQSEWQLTVYQQTHPAPSWNRGGMFYQIMPDRFCKGDLERFLQSVGDDPLGATTKTVLKTDDGGAPNGSPPTGNLAQIPSAYESRVPNHESRVHREDWFGTPEYRPDKSGKILNSDFFGGNLKGITQKLPYLKSLNVTCIYLNPIFEAASNHKYDTGSYRRIDPGFGTTDDLKELIKKAADLDIRVMLDGVFSHTGDDSVYFNKYGRYESVGAYQSKDSPYASWYTFRSHPDDYECWWGIQTLPNTVEQDCGFSEFINGEDGVIRSWTELGLGGWRLDVADELPDGFLDRAADAAKAKDPQVMVLGEVWEDASNKISYSKRRRYLQGGQLDSVTNYPFKEDIIHFIKTGDATKLAHTVNVLINNYPKHVLDNLMNLLGTHDTVRILTALGDSGKADTREQRANAKLLNPAAVIQKLKMATVLQYTLPGCPCVYYGDEAGLEGFEDPFNRRCYPWGRENQE
ncbi:MAG: glycoside hydrolase family 13 protein, partial [Firmicutes bacterium]|nr:glycoside hydrolase family 13 protein [Bacillota bacterium]